MNHSKSSQPSDKHLKLLKRLIASGTPRQYHVYFQEHHEADIADALEELSHDLKQKFFQKVKPEIAAEILEEMEMTQQLEIITEIKTGLAVKYIEEMHRDDAVDLLEELRETDEDKADEIMEALPVSEARDLKELLS